MVPVDEDQYGPLRVGPSHPFYFGHERRTGISPPQDKFAMHKLGIGMYDNVYYFRTKSVPIELRMPKELEAFELVKKLLLEGIELLESVEEKNEELLRMINTGYFMYRTIITTLNIKRFFVQDQIRRYTEDEKERRDAILTMLDILAGERKNAEAAIPLVEFDSVLGYEPSMEYVTDRKRIEWKLDQVDREAEKLRKLLG